jgi:hypothetical protein
MIESVIGALIGLTMVVGLLLLLLIVVIMQNRSSRIRVKLLHEERMLALEKGLPVPMDYTDNAPKRRPYIRGLVFTAIGLGLIAWSAMMGEEQDLGGMGMIPLFIGIALLIGDYINERKKAAKPTTDSAVYASEPVKYP